MKRAWIGVALLSISWIAGAGYFHHADWLVYALAAGIGLMLMIPAGVTIPRNGASLVTVLALLPVIAMLPWPLKLGPIILAIGLALSLATIPRRWPARLGGAMIAGGGVLAAQAVALFVYENITGRSHELPPVLADLLGFVANIVGIDSAADGLDVALHTMRKLHRLGATWELLFDPATFCFIAGGLALLALRGRDPKGPRLVPLAKAIATFLVAMLAWLPLRAGLLMALLVHRALRADYDAPLILMDQFRSIWILLAMLMVPVALAWRFASSVEPDDRDDRVPSPFTPPRRWPVGAATALIGMFLLAFAGLWEPAGVPKAGRILVDEFHSKWEPTQRPFDTEWYGHESGYNYACIYDYLEHFYPVGRITTAIDDKLLENCDVLITKVPTERHAPAEVDAIERFVRRGGGILLVGEHTDVFGTGVSLNDIARRFGFAFRYDVILDTDTAFQQAMVLPRTPHPILQRLPSFDFAVSCSIAPGASVGKPVVLSRSLRGLGPDYHASNFYPQVDDTADERYGAFVQCWATRGGQGRVAAWSDSTVWSNFCAFEPGKCELMMGLISWLNQRDTGFDIRPALWIVATVLLGLSVWISRNWRGGWPVLLAAGMLGWTLASPAVRAVHLGAFPEPALRPDKTLHRVIIDRTICDSPLSSGGFIEGKPEGFGVFERWILRLGYFTRRSAGNDALTGDLVCFAYPNKEVTSEFREALVDYVKRGKKVLLIDSPENTASTANSLLYPFNLQVNHTTNEAGDLTVPPNWPTTHVAAACEVTGGEPLFSLNGKTVAATAHYGAGSVTVIAFGSRFGDASMGVTGDTIPDDDLGKTYALDYALLRWLVEGTNPVPPPATAPTTTPAPATEPAGTTLPTQPGVAEPR